MADTQALAALLARVESGTGEDRELDGQIFIAFIGSPNAALPGVPPTKMQWEYEHSGKWIASAIGGHPIQVAYNVDKFTSSLDVVIALVERVLPGWQWSIASAYPPNRVLAHAQMWTGDDEARASAATPARALLAALIKAKMKNENG